MAEAYICDRCSSAAELVGQPRKDVGRVGEHGGARMTEAIDAFNARRKVDAKKAAKRKRGVKRLPLPPEVREEKVNGKPCRIEGCNGQPIEAHHLVPKQRFGKLDPKQHDPDNVAGFCQQHHTGHTAGIRPLPWECLSDAERAFVCKHNAEGLYI